MGTIHTVRKPKPQKSCKRRSTVAKDVAGDIATEGCLHAGCCLLESIDLGGCFLEFIGAIGAAIVGACHWIGEQVHRFHGLHHHGHLLTHLHRFWA